jgi:hypothetical protein
MDQGIVSNKCDKFIPQFSAGSAGLNYMFEFKGGGAGGKKKKEEFQNLSSSGKSSAGCEGGRMNPQ